MLGKSLRKIFGIKEPNHAPNRKMTWGKQAFVLQDCPSPLEQVVANFTRSVARVQDPAMKRLRDGYGGSGILPSDIPRTQEILDEHVRKNIVCASKDAYLAELNERLTLLTQCAGGTLETWDQIVNTVHSFPFDIPLPNGGLTISTTEKDSFKLAVEGQGQEQAISYEDIRNLPAFHTLLKMAESADTDLNVRFSFRKTIPYVQYTKWPQISVDFSDTGETDFYDVRGMQAKDLEIRFYIGTPFNPNRYPLTNKPKDEKATPGMQMASAFLKRMKEAALKGEKLSDTEKERIRQELEAQYGEKFGPSALRTPKLKI